MLDYDAKHGAYKVQIDGSTVVKMASEKMLALRPEASSAAPPPPEPPAEPPAVNERLERARAAGAGGRGMPGRGRGLPGRGGALARAAALRT